MTLTFVRTRHAYDSYSDLWTLVELSGFDTCFIDEMDVSRKAHTYILPTLNGEVGAGWQGAQARLIHLNMEWDEYPPTPGISETWHGDRWFAQQIGARYVPLGSHADLRPNTDSLSPDAYEVAFLAYLIPRRQQMQHDLRQAGLSVSPSSAWGDERHRLLANSRVYAHVHQHDDKPGVPPLRLVVAAAYGMPFVTEQCADAGIFSEVIMQAPYSHYAGFTRDWLRDAGDMLQAKGAALHDLLCREFTFRQSVEAAL